MTYFSDVDEEPEEEYVSSNWCVVVTRLTIKGRRSETPAYPMYCYCYLRRLREALYLLAWNQLKIPTLCSSEQNNSFCIHMDLVYKRQAIERVRFLTFRTFFRWTVFTLGMKPVKGIGFDKDIENFDDVKHGFKWMEPWLHHQCKTTQYLKTQKLNRRKNRRCKMGRCLKREPFPALNGLMHIYSAYQVLLFNSRGSQLMTSQNNGMTCKTRFIFQQNNSLAGDIVLTFFAGAGLNELFFGLKKMTDDDYNATQSMEKVKGCYFSGCRATNIFMEISYRKRQKLTQVLRLETMAKKRFCFQVYQNIGEAVSGISHEPPLSDETVHIVLCKSFAHVIQDELQHHPLATSDLCNDIAFKILEYVVVRCFDKWHKLYKPNLMQFVFCNCCWYCYTLQTKDP